VGLLSLVATQNYRLRRSAVHLLTMFFCVSCATTGPSEYVEIGATDPASLRSYIDPESIRKLPDEVNTEKPVDIATIRSYPKVEFGDEAFTGTLKACSEKASIEKVDQVALQTGTAFAGASLGTLISVAVNPIMLPVAGALVLLQTVGAGAVAAAKDEAQEANRRAAVMFICLNSFGYSAALRKRSSFSEPQAIIVSKDAETVGDPLEEKSLDMSKCIRHQASCRE